ncbi:FAD-binding domain-containing protein [Trametes sanguinea]|nr:FAD-binding domain-containing protein [Trametes sanguinea]
MGQHSIFNGSGSRRVSVCYAVLLSLAASSVAAPQPIAGQAHYTAVCETISHAISSASSVYWPGSGQFYTNDIEHYASSSSMQAACSVEPGTEEDIAVILRIVAENRTPFAVKSGGHGMNPQYSSTPGVHIAMSRFNEVKYCPEENVAEVGAGLIWDDVYGALDPQGVTVLGGRASGIGVGGLALGGGYSWKTNQFGLTVDNLTGHKVVLPDGRVLTVNEKSYSDLFWGLKGGANNFGIVTRFNLTTYSQTEIWGGTISTNATYIDAVNAATAKFSQTVTDPKAQILPSYTFVQGQLIASVSLFYDAPAQPKSIFDDFLAIPTTAMDLKIRPLRDFVRTAPTNSTLGLRGVYNTVSVLNYTEHMLEAIVNETKFWGERLPAGASSVTYSTEPFLPSIFSHASVDSAAYPPNRSVGPSPLAIAFAWNDTTADEAIYDAARKSATRLTQAMLSEGQKLQDVPLYGNYAIFGTPLEKIYGVHLPKLQALRAKYDPYRVMNLAGGWKF